MRQRALILGAFLTLWTVLALLASGGLSQARWHDRLDVNVPDGVSATLTGTATDIPSDRQQVTNNPSFAATNTSPAHQGWINVTSVQIRPGQLGGQSLASAIGVSYATGPVGGDCTGSTTAHWQAGNVGGITLGATYPRPADNVASAWLDPAQTRPLCLTFPGATNSPAFFRAHAGRDLIVRTSVELRSQPPATWTSGVGTVDSAFTVAFPRPTPRNDDVLPLTNSCAVSGIFGGTLALRWAWPNPGSTGNVATPAVARWQVWSAPSGTGAWTLLGQVGGSSRTASLNVGTGGLTSSFTDFKIVAVLDNAGTYFVESSHITTIRQSLLATACDSVRIADNPNPGGPVVLP